MNSAAGTVTELHRWPVKSMAGQPVDELAVDRRGGEGDRGHAVFDVHKGAPGGLRRGRRRGCWRGGPSIAPAPPSPSCAPPAAPNGSGRIPAFPGRCPATWGRDVSLHSDPDLQQDLPDSLLVTLQATLEAVSAELAAPLDLRRFRTNVHVSLNAAPFAEEAWEGRRLAVGDADLELLHPCLRCAIPTRDPDTQAKWALLLRHLTDNHSCRFGINARAARPSTIRVGDRVELRP